jgi:hypothetical protein
MHKSSGANFARFAFTAVALAFESAHLYLEDLHGGVLAHHLLNRPDLPAISNWWGLVLIPVLTWFQVGRIQARVQKKNAYRSDMPRVPAAVMLAFTASLAYGAALSFAFISNYEAISYVFLGAFVVSLLVPTYRAEYILGFVLGMTFTFGAAIPIIIAAVVASFSRLVDLVFNFALRLIRTNPPPRAM